MIFISIRNTESGIYRAVDSPPTLALHPHLAVSKLLNDLISRSSKKTTQVAKAAGLPRIVLYDLLRCRRLFKTDYISPLAKALDLGTEVIAQLTTLAAECRRSDQSPSEVAASPEMIALGIMLRTTRKSLGKPLLTISAELGMHAPNYCNYERGLRRMSMATAHRIARTLKMPEQTAKDFLNLVAATNSKVRCPVPVSTGSGVGQLQLELSRRGVAIADGDQLTTELTPKAFGELQSILPQLQQLLLKRPCNTQLAQSAAQPSPLDQTPFSAIIEHANGSTTFVMMDDRTTDREPSKSFSTTHASDVCGTGPQDSHTNGESR